MSTSSGAIFNGSSRFSADFQNVVTRTIGIASLPMMHMQNVKNDLGSQFTGLSSLDAKVTLLQSALSTLSSGLGSASYAASVSDATMVRASASSGVREGTYSIDVTSFGSVANAVGKASGPGIQLVTDPSTQNISVDGTFQLYLNLAPFTITPASNNLNALADAISQSTAGLQATVVNLGSTDSPDYRLSIQSTKFAANAIQLKDSANNELLDQPVPGSPVKYKPNGGAEVTSSTRSATLTPGLTVDLLKANAADVATTITVTRNTSAVTKSLAALVSAYNGVVSEVDSNRGSGTGVLKGNSILSSVTDALRKITGYSSGSSGLSSLTALGLSFDKDTQLLTFDAAVFSAATSANVAGLSAFLGSATTGGFLKTATDAMTSLEDSTSGILKTNLASVQKQITTQSEKIAKEQERIDQLTKDTQARMAAADALISAMEQQAGFFTNLFQSMSEAAKNQQ